ncbi:MAG: hybrid sensor histidine kinase/response regulator [Xenococcaceae cyanobacterium MO_188.B19]|nr:hybrid sensor histidine kinase/response regulator [Xenococcaceae cyanobacterium MO_188.B19]
MTIDTDQQIQLNFLEEAKEYCDRLESTLLDLDSQGFNTELLDESMRAAHSLKGGAAMMGFSALQDVSHRLEDFFKILRSRKDASLLNREVTTLLLQGVDCLREVAQAHRSLSSIDEEWLNQLTNSIFDPLHDKLGDLKDEDEDLLLAEEEEVDVSTLVFETGVEECLDSLEPKLDSLSAEELKEELIIQTVQLAEFGRMSNLDAFVELCDSVNKQLAALSLPEIRDFAYRAFKTWEQAHALVTLGRIDQIPNQLFATSRTNKAEPESLSLPDSETIDLSEIAELQEMVAMELETNSEIFNPEATDLETIDLSEIAELQEMVALELETNSETFNPETTDLETPVVDWDQLTADTDELADLQSSFADLEAFEPNEIDQTIPIPEEKTRSVAVQSSGSETMVKVSARQLKEINALSSKLILERNAAVLRLNQLHKYLALTKERIRALDKSSNQIRKVYDWASLEGMLTTANQGNQNDSPSQTNNSSQQELIPDNQTNTFDTLEMDRYSDLHLLFQEQMETIFQLGEVTTDIDLGLREMSQVVRDFSYTSKELQQNITRSQMRPFSDIIGRFPRFIRDLSVQYNKQVNLKITGENTLIDRQVLEQLGDPLNHLLRNAFDHGIEEPEVRIQQEKTPEGTIWLRAMQRGNKTIITIEDDGKGIDEQKIRDRLCQMGLSRAEVNQIESKELLEAIFEPGFSTAKQVTDLSGRGVGMDVVRSNLSMVRGDIKVETTLGKGTKFTITVPLSLLILRVTILESAGMVFAVPIHSVQEIVRFDSDIVVQEGEQELIYWNNQQIALIRLENWLRFQRPAKAFDMESKPTIDTPTVLIFQQEDQWLGIYIERYWGEQEVAMRSVISPIALPPGFTGSTILGDGRVIPSIEPSFLAEWITKQQDAKDKISNSVAINNPQSDLFTINSSTILVVDDSVNVRRYVAVMLERNGYQVEQAKDGRDAVEKLQAGLDVQAVICDIEMPRLDGYGVLAEIKSQANFADLPIVMLTSRSNDKHRKLAMKLGASAYLSKPLNEPELLQILETHIQNPVFHR